jgi:hypothetical protein
MRKRIELMGAFVLKGIVVTALGAVLYWIREEVTGPGLASFARGLRLLAP